MNKPNSIKQGSVLALSSMSNGIVKENKKNNLTQSIKKLEEDFIVKTDEHIFCSVKEESCDAKSRANDLMSLF